MKLCTHCGSPLAADAAFCPACGTRAGTPAEILPQTPAAAPPEPPAQDPPAEPQPPLPGDGRITFAPEDTTAPGAPSAPGPRYRRTEPQQPDGGLTTAQYFWTLMLFAVPVVGLGFMLYWSFGRTASPARRRLARASLIKAGIGLVAGLAVLVFLVAAWFRLDPWGWNSPSGYDPYNDYGYYEDWYGDYFWDYGSGFEDFYGEPFDFFGNSDQNDRIY